MKKWHIEFRIRKGEKFGFNAEYETKVFEVEGDDVDRIITRLKRDIPKYSSIMFQRID